MCLSFSNESDRLILGLAVGVGCRTLYVWGSQATMADYGRSFSLPLLLPVAATFA